MKKLLAITLSIIMVFSLCACGNKETEKINCSSCGESISKDVAFCEHCGAEVNNEKTESKDTSSDNSSSTESKTEETSKPSSSTTVSSKGETSKSTHSHSYINETITKQPTCTEQGIKTYYCSSCSSTKIEYIEALNHKWEDATCTSPKSCLLCNKKEGEALQHKYSANNCIICGKEKITFNYGWEVYPLEFSGFVITELKCYVENNMIYAEFGYTSKSAYTVQFDIELLQPNKEKVAYFTFVDDINTGEHKTRKFCIASGTTFLQLEGEYYPVISNSHSVS